MRIIAGTARSLPLKTIEGAGNAPDNRQDQRDIIQYAAE